MPEMWQLLSLSGDLIILIIKTNMSIFKAYDIRGEYPLELDESKACSIGWALVRFLKSNLPEGKGQSGKKSNYQPKIVVGRDIRLSSPLLSRSLIKGLLEGGAEVTDIGEVTTPMLYFASGFYHFDGSVMVTASHNPPQYNGFKICREKAIALSENTGLRDIEKICAEYKANDKRKVKDALTLKDIRADYKKFIRRFMICNKVKDTIKIVADAANGSVGPVFEEIFGREYLSSQKIKIIPLYFKPDGRFLNHEPNPMKDESLRNIKMVIKKEKANLGVAFDGDGDRVVFLDEKAERIPNDLITVIIAREILRESKKTSIVYDLRSSRIVSEEIKRLGGNPVRERVGHAFIKATMRKYNASFGGELSGHYYYRDNFFADSALITFVYILNILIRENRLISSIIKPLEQYFSSGELNFVVKDKEEKIEEIIREFSPGSDRQDGKIDYLDGVTIEYDDWWFNLRSSNTEPLLRLNIEAKTNKQLKTAMRRLGKILGKEI